MSKKQGWVLGATFLALVAIIAGICFVFFGNKIVKSAPKTLTVETVDDKFYLTTEYNSEFGYQFVIEQNIDGEYVVVKVVDSKENSINLIVYDVKIEAGQTYRFSACYTTENGAGNGEYSEYLVWEPSWKLSTINYSKASYSETTGLLTWDSVYLADSYEIRIVDLEGNVETKTVTSASCQISDLSVGKYKIFVVAKSTNEFLTESNVGTGFNFVVEKDNEILSATKNANGVLTVRTSQKIETFEVYADGVLKATLTAGEASMQSGTFVYVFENTAMIFDNLDFSTVVVQIKSLSTSFVGESNLTIIN